MSRFHLALLTVGALAVVGLVTWRLRQSGGSPVDSLRQLAHAARAKDRRAIEQYLDVSRVAESVVDETFATATTLAAAAPSDRESAELSTLEALRPSVMTLVERNIWATLLDSSATLHESRVSPTAVAALDLRALIDRYQGIADVQQRGRVARVGVRIRLDDGASAAIVHLRMEPAAGHWRVIGVEDLGPYIRSAFERRSQRGYESAIRANLRNLATAQDAYFAAHANYAPALGALAYSPTPGVSMQITAATREGWSAVARHEQGTAECRISVGSAVPPGDVEREAKCSSRLPPK